MSNCVAFPRSNELILSPKRFDVPGLWAKIQATPETLEAAKAHGSDFLWWYLTRDNCFLRDGKLHILLGEGRSTHTFRDLRGVFLTLSQHCKKATTFGLHLQDLDDPSPPSWAQCRVTPGAVAGL